VIRRARPGALPRLTEPPYETRRVNGYKPMIPRKTLGVTMTIPWNSLSVSRSLSPVTIAWTWPPTAQRSTGRSLKSRRSDGAGISAGVTSVPSTRCLAITSATVRPRTRKREVGVTRRSHDGRAARRGLR